MADFLETSNSKAGMFRDVIFEQDYDPLSTRAHTLRIPTGVCQCVCECVCVCVRVLVCNL